MLKLYSKKSHLTMFFFASKENLMQDKIVVVAEHRYEWHDIGVEKGLWQTVEGLINIGYTIFFDGITAFLIKSVQMQ